MAGNTYDTGGFLQVPLYNSSYEISKDPALASLNLTADPYARKVSNQELIYAMLCSWSLLLVVPTFVWHIQKRNLPVTCLAFWSIWLNFMNLVNVCFWGGDDLSIWFWGYGLCDVAVKMDVASGLGVIGAVVCIFRSLARALNANRVRLVPSRAETNRRRVIEGFYCIGLPLLAALFHYFVQSRRYYIYALAGCMYTVSKTWPDILFIWAWPPFFALVAGYYAYLVMFRSVHYRRQFDRVMHANSVGLNRERFMRLCAIASMLLIVYLPVELYVFWWNVVLTPLGPYSWDEVHSPDTWNYLLFFPANGQVFYDRWIYMSLGYAIFFTLGLGSDAYEGYRRWMAMLGVSPPFFPCIGRRHHSTYGTRQSTCGSDRNVGGLDLSTFGPDHNTDGSHLSTDGLCSNTDGPCQSNYDRRHSTLSVSSTLVGHEDANRHANLTLRLAQRNESSDFANWVTEINRLHTPGAAAVFGSERSVLPSIAEHYDLEIDRGTVSE